jgi:hypothetical protein
MPAGNRPSSGEFDEESRWAGIATVAKDEADAESSKAAPQEQQKRLVSAFWAAHERQAAMRVHLAHASFTSPSQTLAANFLRNTGLARSATPDPPQAGCCRCRSLAKNH